MPRVQVVTDEGEVIGEVPIYATNLGTAKKPRFGHGWDGTEFERLWSLAAAHEERERQIQETDLEPAHP